MLVRNRPGDGPGDDRKRPCDERQREAGVEVFVFRRVASMQFAAGMQVFPGGRVDERDCDESVPWGGPGPQTFAGPLSADVGLARALVVAAVRETFEECGVLLAGPPGGDVVTLTEQDWQNGWRERHERVLSGAGGLSELLNETGLVLRADLVRPWAHWITPPGEGSRRYDTRFFVAAMPTGQLARDLGGEGEHARWLPAAEGVRQYVDGKVRMLPPTVVCLEELAAAPSVAALLATPRRIRPVMPWLVGMPDGGLAVQVDLDGLGGGEPWAGYPGTAGEGGTA
jgi:8-oxo-dGTP pyrophosphatase MutT (NUDIX family)